jgi:hypothetical protein
LLQRRIATLGSDPSADLEPCEPQEAGRGPTIRPANSCGGKFKAINPFPQYPHETAAVTWRDRSQVALPPLEGGRLDAFLNEHAEIGSGPPRRKNRIALAPTFAQYPTMLARVLSAAVNGIEAFPVEVEVNCGWGDTIIVLIMSIPPIPTPSFSYRKTRPLAQQHFAKVWVTPLIK